LYNTTYVSTGPAKNIQGGPKVGIQCIVYTCIITVYLFLAHSVSALTTKINFKPLFMGCAEMAMQLRHADKMCFTKELEMKQAPPPTEGRGPIQQHTTRR
jgi:hypothetical protein